MFTENAEDRHGTRVPLHNTDDNGERPHQPEEAESSSSGNDTPNDGTWGERDVGGPVNFRNAMLDYEEMRRELTSLSKTRSAGAKSAKTTKTNRSEPRRTKSARQERDVEAQGEGEKEGEDEDDDFEFGDFLKDGHFEKRQEGRSAKKVGIVYKNVSVKGVGATTTFVKTLPSAVIGVRLQPLLKLSHKILIISRLSAPICTSFFRDLFPFSPNLELQEKREI
jgi:hypothetical protein